MIRQEVLAEDEFEDEDGSQAKPEQRNRFHIQLKHKTFLTTMRTRKFWINNTTVRLKI